MSANNYPDPEELTKLNLLLGLIEKRGTSESLTSVHAMSVRIPTFDAAQIEAFAQHSGVSKNKIICHLLDLAISQISAGLDEENSAAIKELTFNIYGEMTGCKFVPGEGFDLTDKKELPQAEKGEC